MHLSLTGSPRRVDAWPRYDGVGIMSLSRRHNDALPSSGIKSASPQRRSYQLALITQSRKRRDICVDCFSPHKRDMPTVGNLRRLLFGDLTKLRRRHTKY